MLYYSRYGFSSLIAFLLQTTTTIHQKTKSSLEEADSDTARLNPQQLDKRRCNPSAKVTAYASSKFTRKTCRYTGNVQGIGTFGRMFVRSDRLPLRSSPKNTQKFLPSLGSLEP
ncbi:MAG: hypothetical protein PUP91_01890 [Rhizonema sp. PD37]|nr:hypothetical protein [Rhizonema sp. PD37]